MKPVLVRVCLILLAAAVPLVLVRPLVSELVAKGLKEKEITIASRITPEDGRYHALLGLLYYHSPWNSPSGPDAGRAAEMYISALQRNPTDSSTWFALAKACRDLGRPEGERALRRALSVDRSNPSLLWEAAVFSLVGDDADRATDFFRRYIQMFPGEQGRVYSLAYLMGMDPGYLLERLIPRSLTYYSGYLRFLMANRSVEQSLEVWKRMKSLGPDGEDYLQYCDFLIASGFYESAVAVWEGFLARKGMRYHPGLWNGEFEIPFAEGGLDWKKGKASGVKTDRDSDTHWKGRASLRVRFDGKNNPEAIIASQVVPLEPGRRYTLTGYVKTEGITTTNGLFLEVAGLKGAPLALRTEPLTGTIQWLRQELSFTVPPDCGAVRISIRRSRSSKFDNRIGGKAWIDSLSLTEG
jgi:tetratricopeptide (TPR) repeat protein